MVGQVRLNTWNGSFFDTLSQRNLSGLLHQLVVFFVIVGALLALVVGQTWMQQMLKVRLREWLTHHLLDEWLVAGRAYRLGLAGQIGVNPDQRIEEDTRKLTDLSASLGVGLFQATPAAHQLHQHPVGAVRPPRLQSVRRSFTIPGYMVWCAIIYAAIGSLLTWRVGTPLIGLNAELYAREAELRFALVRVNESAESIALCGGEHDERRLLDNTLERVISTMRQLSGALSRLTWITSGYGWIAIVVPIVVASPGYFSGGLTIGGLMMVVGAFNQVQSSLRWFVDQFPAIADWRATLHRVSAFKAVIDKVDAIDDGIDTIKLTRHPDGKLAFDGVSVLLSDGRVVISDATVEIEPGDRVLIVGESGAGKSTLFRALAGLWPWGSGTIRLPDPDSMMFMPQRPYLPLGTMRAAITYPDPPDAFETAEVTAVVKRVGLAEFLPTLDFESRAGQELLARPAADARLRPLAAAPAGLGIPGRGDLRARRGEPAPGDVDLRPRAANATVVSIGHRPGLEHFHTRVLTLIRTPNGAMLDHTPPPQIRHHFWPFGRHGAPVAGPPPPPMRASGAPGAPAADACRRSA